MKKFIEKLIAEIRCEQLRYDEQSYEYQRLEDLIKTLTNWM